METRHREAEMALDPRPGERVYQEIKQSILSGQFAVHQRLDIDKLAAQLSVSATPVRYALAILASERLVKLNASRMYQVAFWSERELRELYQWRQQLAKWALETYVPTPLTPSVTPERDYTAAFLAIMRHLDNAANLEARRAARAGDDRLHAALRFEKDVLPGAAGELSKIANSLEKGGASLGTGLRTYFKRRIAQCAQIRSAAHASGMPDNGD